MGSLKKLWGWYKTGEYWVKLQVDSLGKVILSNIPGHHTQHEIGGSDEIEGLSDITPDRIKNETKARAYLSVRQLNIVHNTSTKVLLDTENYDVGSDFADYKFVAPVSGYYIATTQISWTQIVANKDYAAFISKNGAIISRNWAQSSTATALSNVITDIVYLAAGNYIELYAYHYAGVNTPDIGEGSTSTFLAIHLLSV